jgi:5'-nucleotidase
MDFSGHRVLLTNDDGIHAPGIVLLEKIIRRYTEEVWVVAPSEERSGASHSISMHDPIRHRALDDRHHAIKGTPTDCALISPRTSPIRARRRRRWRARCSACRRSR